MDSYLNLLRGLRRLFPCSVLLLGYFFANAAQAATSTCVYPNTAVSNVLVFTAPITTAGSRSLNTVLQSVALQPGLAITSTADNIVETASVNGILVPGFTNVYKTNLSGIGIKFQVTTGYNGGFSDAPFTNTFSKSTAGGSLHYVQAQLVVVGPIQSGILMSLPSMTVSFTGGCSNAPSATWTLASGSAINALTCAVSASSKNVTVPLGLVKTSQFSGVGSTAGSANFNIVLENCSVGVNLFATFTDGNFPGNRSNALSLTNDAQVAHGVGIRIRTGGGAIVTYGPDSYLPGTLNQMALGQSTMGTMTIPFTASYVQTGATISSGIANGMATFTLSYQ
ncbi:fimbrial protein [Pseudomonas jessenii]|uniref:fimbrial protein n=1 Tax=Pseudomonas jessenii TaxID=77298 RepID=UPI000FB0BFDD